MPQLKFEKIVLVVSVCVFAAAAGYLSWVKKTSSAAVATGQRSASSQQAEKRPSRVSSPSPAVASKPAPKTVDWTKLWPAVDAMLRKEFPNVGIGDSRPVKVHEEADITGDGIPEAIINLGTGGASADLMTLIRLDDGKPVAARFNQPKRKNYTDVFLVGGSVRHGSGVTMLPEKRAIAFDFYSTDDSGAVDSCGVGVFQWNAATKTFDNVEALGREMTRDYCESARGRWP